MPRVLTRKILLLSLGLATQIYAVSGVSSEGNSTISQGYWVTRLDKPGEDIPRQGRSLFDKLFGGKSVSDARYNIPFPFVALVKFLQKNVSHSQRKSISQVMIPLGRSLQRGAAAPDYFRYPRRVIMVNGERVGTASEPALVFRNRMFIAYQEKAMQLEVISYNDEAGRFEFQTVTEYGPDQMPQTRYANRAVCMGCHQNGAPIFSKSPWAETNFNPAIASAISQAQPEVYPSFLDAISFDASTMDIATNYANYLGVSQLLWREGCESERPEMAVSVECRAALLIAALQFKLSGNLAFDQDGDRFQKYGLTHIARHWQRMWPGGLLIPTADIDDIDPLADVANRQVLATDESNSDPLVQRPPGAHWKTLNLSLMRGIVEQFAGFLADSDARKLDQKLIGLVQTSEHPGTLLQANCMIRLEGAGEGWTKAKLDCDTDSLKLSLRLKQNGNKLREYVIEKLEFPGLGYIWNVGLRQPDYTSSAGVERISSALNNHKSNTSARFSSGDRLGRLNIEWRKTALINGIATTFAAVTVEMVKDFQAVESAIERMSRQTINGENNALGFQFFRRQDIVKELLHNLGKIVTTD